MNPSFFQTADITTLQKMSDTLRFLCADMVQVANSGHPGAPMGLADVAVVLSFYIKINPKNPCWINRDRIIFSGGHVSALVYSLLHLWGFGISLEDLKEFRKLGSKTPGHPEFGHTEGVEITTGPLGQGIANAVGFAMASVYARNILETKVINHKIYCFCGDGDLQEGISYEAVSLAGHHELNNLILIYDSNTITIEGNTKISMSENIAQRFEAQKWHVLECDGHDFISINKALSSAQNMDKPTIIIANTKIGKKAIGLEGSHKTHGSPLGEDVIKESKKSAGFDKNKNFFIPECVALRFKNVYERGQMEEKLWQANLSNKTLAKIDRMQNPNFESIKYPEFSNVKAIATRVSNGKILNAISMNLEGFIGGSADLAPSNNTHLENEGDFPEGKNLHFGIREHSMGAIINGIANYGLFLPFCATFFVFSDYMSASMRIASIMKAKVFYIFTHDSIGVGEDGATHQPIEQLSHFRAMPNLFVFRPSDAYENIACWQIALSLNAPCAFVLSRQNLPVLSPVKIEQIKHGGYILKDCKNPQITLLASGSEVALALEGARILEEKRISVRVVSVPCYDLLIMQDDDYIKDLFAGTKVLAIEASRGLEWYRFADDVINMESFGSSGRGDELFEHYGFTSQNIVKRVKALLA